MGAVSGGALKRRGLWLNYRSPWGVHFHGGEQMLIGLRTRLAPANLSRHFKLHPRNQQSDKNYVIRGNII